MEENAGKLSIAVVGGGVAGITAAYLLGKRHHVTLIERSDYVGGHTNTITVEDAPGKSIAVDTGFIVCNPKNYPLFYRLLAEWGVALRDSDMSFGYMCEQSKLGYMGPSPRQFLRKPGNLLRPSFLGMIAEQRRFYRRATRDLQIGVIGNQPLGQYLESIQASPYFIRHFLIPLSASVWSSPDADMMDFPAQTFLRFFSNHCLLQLGGLPTWQTVVGGSQTYVRAFTSRFTGKILTSTPVRAIRRPTQDAAHQHVGVQLHDGQTLGFDRVVLATHADISLRLLADASDTERELLSAWAYHRNATVLHTDTSLMPRDRRVWASWNYYRPADTAPDDPVPITYYMNRLQGLESDRHYFVTLNAHRPIDPKAILYEVEYTHPAYKPRSVEAQRRIRERNGQDKTYFCGSYMGYGFHEDAVASAVGVARQMGVTL